MQNSKLSTIIFPKLGNSWQRFIANVEVELNSIKSLKKTDDERITKLGSYIPKIKEACEKSKDDIAEILNYRAVFTDNDSSLNSLFDALEFFKLQNNFDNDAVKTLYHKIVESPTIVELTEEYNGLLIRKDYVKEQIKPLEDLIRGKKIDQNLIQELLDKFYLDDKTKKDVLLYSLVISAVKQEDIKNTKEAATNRKNEKAKLYRDKIKELCETYQTMKDQFKALFDTCYSIRRKMTLDEVNMYKGYIGNPSEALSYGFSDDAMLKIYSMSLFKTKEDIDNYIEGINDLEMETANLSGEISFFQELINEFGEIAKKITDLLEVEDEKEEEETEENKRVFFLVDPFNRLVVDSKLMSMNKNSLNAFIRKVNSSDNHMIEGIRAGQMLGVEEAEKAIDRSISLMSTSNYKLAYSKIKDSVLVLGMTDSGDTKFHSVLNSIVKGGREIIKRQIKIIEEADEEREKQDYIASQNEMIGKILKEDKKRK